MTLISQIDNQQKENLLTIFQFLSVCESLENNQKENSYKIIEKQYYIPLVSFLNQLNFKIYLNPLTFFDLNKILSNIMSTGTHIDLFGYFIKLTLCQRKNLLNIVKFVYDYQQNQVDEKSSGDIAHRYWNDYIDLTQKLESLLINENTEDY
ncbi:hypothetical protein [Rivularia sp. UHCC 0363]|uniref:hypothetical protein n=1 Tax=Rivularia sp. UHCC 0363 TaxID=3110244 RepID=UPI002B20F21E|nr:hypothetical protein [Rivularia sp. UHCC 0363]MEA5594634.1 hypothetical protein [Rivularia sp. UHCC 0363]